MTTVYTSWHIGDSEAIKSTVETEEMDFFHSSGNLLEAPNWDRMMQWIEAGNKLNIQAYHQNVRIYGKTAVYTAYESVDITAPNGDSVTETRRSTNVLIKKNGTWKMIHWHGSQLTPVNP